MNITTARLFLRPFLDSDIPAYARIRAKPEVIAQLPGGVDQAAKSMEVARRVVPAFAQSWTRGQYAPWAVVEKETEQLVGHLGLRIVPELDDATELLYMIDSAYWRRGYATEGAIAALGFGFKTRDLPFIIALALPVNKASIRVMQKIGMKRDGNFDAFGLNGVKYRITRSDFDSSS